VNIYDQLHMKRVRSSIETYLENGCEKSVRLNKYLDCRLSLEAYLWIVDMILKYNLGLNLCVVPTICYIVIILDQRMRYQKNWLIA